MALHIHGEEGHCRLGVDGDLTIFQVAEYRQQLLAECAQAGTVTLDLSETRELDTSGVQLLLALRKQVMAGGGKLKLAGISDAAGKTLAVFNLAAEFPLEAEGD